MNPNWLGVLSALLALAAFLVTHRKARNFSVKTKIWATLFASLLSLPGASFAIFYAHLFPETSGYYQFRSIAGTEFLLVMLGIAGGLLASLLPRVLLIIPLLGVAAFCTAPIIKPFIGPIPANTFHEDWDGEVCRQSTPSTCGAASTATILKMLGVKVMESTLAKEAHSYAGGTEAWYLARAVRSRGCEVTFDFRKAFSPEKQLPAVVGVRLGSVGHFIAVLARDGDRYTIGDPLRGREVLTMEELKERYEFTAFHMHIHKP